MEETMENIIQVEEWNAQDAIALKRLLSKFIKSYGEKSPDIDDQTWLKARFMEELPSISEGAAERLASETVAAVQEYDENLSSIHRAAAKGTNTEKWLANQIAKASSGISVVQHGEYLKQINTALANANAQMMRTVITNSGEVSQCFNLDGFIAEQHHVNSFNANAALTKSKFFAQVKVPEAGETYGKNSFDIVILDATKAKTTPVHQYQVKYGADAKATIQLLREHGDVTKYSNQQILVPPEQLDEVRKAFPGKTIVSKIGGTDVVPIKSKSLTKAEAKELQLRVQQDGNIPETDWNSFQTKDLAVQIGKNAGMVGLQAAVITTGFSLAEQAIQGDGIDVDESITLALKTGTDAGIKAAAAGALKVGIEKGIVRIIPPATPMGVIVNIVCVSIENIKILMKVVSGEITLSQAMEQMGRTTCAMVFGMGWGVAGAGIGAAALSWIPIIGPIVGGFVGGVVGYMAGSKVGETIHKGFSIVKKGVVTACKAGWNMLKNVAKKAILSKITS
jgi:hypothetical protein